MKYICEAVCPELDKDGSKHCSYVVSTTVELHELLNMECPCGNDTKFVQALAADGPIELFGSTQNKPREDCDFEKMSREQLLEKVNSYFYEVAGIMHSVNKFIDENECAGMDNVQKSTYVREKVLKMLETQKTESVKEEKIWF